MKTHPEAGANLLELRPRRNAEWETAEGGRVVLLVPKFRNRRVRSWLVPLLARPDFRVKLDDLGTSFWRLCDGTMPISEIAERIAVEFGAEEEALWDRIARFVVKLEREGLLVLAAPKKI